MNHPRRPGLFQPVLVAWGDESRATRDRFDRATHTAPLISTGHTQGSISARAEGFSQVLRRGRRLLEACNIWGIADSFHDSSVTHEHSRSRAKRTSVLV